MEIWLCCLPLSATWASDTLSLNFRLLISKRRIVIHPFHRTVVKIKWDKSKKLLSRVFDIERAIEQEEEEE